MKIEQANKGITNKEYLHIGEFDTGDILQSEIGCLWIKVGEGNNNINALRLDGKESIGIGVSKMLFKEYKRQLTLKQ